MRFFPLLRSEFHRLLGCAALTSGLSAQSYLEVTFEDGTPGESPVGNYTLSPSGNTSSNGAVVVDAVTTPANVLAGQSLYLYDLSGDLTTGDPTHWRGEFNGGDDVSDVRVDFDFRRGFAAIDQADTDTRFHFALGRAGDSLNNSDFRPFEIRILNNGDLVVNSVDGSATAGQHVTTGSNHLTLLVNSHDTAAVDYADETLGSGSVAPNSFVVFLNGVSLGPFTFHQTPDPANAPQVDFRAQNNDLGQFAFYQDSKRQGELVLDNLSITALAAPVASVAAPTGLTAGAGSASSVTLTWTDVADNELNYRVERKSAGGSYAVIAELAADATSHTDTSVAASSSYTYRVVAQAGVVSSDVSNEAEVTTPAQVAPQIQVTFTGTGSVINGGTTTLSVSAVGEEPLTYQWYIGASGDDSQPIDGAVNASLTLSPVTADTSVWVRVSNESGSDDSSTIEVEVLNLLTTVVATEAELEAALATARAGDTVLMADGEWRDVVIRLSGNVDASLPLTLGAVNPGKVLMTGASRVQIGGSHVVLRDLVFQGPYSGNDDEVIQFRNGGANPARSCRVTNVAIIDYVPADGRDTDWVSFYGSDNRVDHCYFSGHDVPGVTMVVWLDGEPDNHRIDHNHFANRANGGGENGWETIRVGTSGTSMSDSRTVVEHNLFTRVDGEIEIISNKSGGNIYRHNTFLECAGTLTLRHGNGCLVDSNIFLGRSRDGSGGIRVIGEDHVIVNNHIEGTRERDGAAITVYAGVDGGALNEYFAAHGALIAHNTFVDNLGTAIDIGTGLGSRDRTILPTGVRVVNNLMTRATDSSAAYVTGEGAPAATYLANLYFNGSPGLDFLSGLFEIDPAMTWDARRLLTLASAFGPVVDAGTADVTAVLHDAEGRLRSPPPDVGAHEVSSALASTTFGPATTLTTGPDYLSADRQFGVPNARMVNSSVRARSDPGESGLINGFVVGGDALKSVLVRTVGPGLEPFGVEGVMARPSVVVTNSSGAEVASNAGWESGPTGELDQASAAVGAFELQRGVADSAVVATLAPGAYTAQVVPTNGEGGTVLVEVYDLTPGSGTLLNQSARGDVRDGQDVLIAGFVVNGTAPRRALVRCAGPALVEFGVAGALADPSLELHTTGSDVVLSNDNWSEGDDAAEISTAAETVGAFAFAADSADAAMLVTLAPGVYTVHARGVDGAQGTVLLEVYFLAE